MAFGQWWMFIEAVEGPIGRDHGALPFHPEGQMAARRADLEHRLVAKVYPPKVSTFSPPQILLASEPGYLLASAMAATFVGRPRQQCREPGPMLGAMDLRITDNRHRIQKESEAGARTGTADAPCSYSADLSMPRVGDDPLARRRRGGRMIDRRERPSSSVRPQADSTSASSHSAAQSAPAGRAVDRAQAGAALGRARQWIKRRNAPPKPPACPQTPRPHRDRRLEGRQAAFLPQSRDEARSAPWRQVLSFAHTTSSVTHPYPANVPKPQSELAMTRSRSPTAATAASMRWATTSGCSTKLLFESITPGSSTMWSGRRCRRNAAISCWRRGLANSMLSPPTLAW